MHFVLTAVVFAALVLGLPASAQGTPSALVQEYFKTIATAKMPQELDKFCSKRYLAQRKEMFTGVPPARLSKFMNFTRQGFPKSIKITSEKLDGDKASLQVEGNGQPMVKPEVSSDGVSMSLQNYGNLFLVRENGWKIDAENWDSKPIPNMMNPNDWRAAVKALVNQDAPSTPVDGKLEGKPFKPTSITAGSGDFGGTWVHFSNKSTGQKLSLGLLDDDEKGNLEGKTFTMADDKLSWPKKRMFNILMESKDLTNGTRTVAGAGIGVMKLTFGHRTAAGIPGTIILKLYAQPEVSLTGQFVAVPE
jgi:hypothetical protein